jgi:hypothetical protein
MFNTRKFSLTREESAKSGDYKYLMLAMSIPERRGEIFVGSRDETDENGKLCADCRGDEDWEECRTLKLDDNASLLRRIFDLSGELGFGTRDGEESLLRKRRNPFVMYCWNTCEDRDMSAEISDFG